MSKAQAAQPDRPAKKGGLVAETVEIIKTVVYALLIALVLRVLLFQPYTIPSASMEPNLYRGDYIIVSKWSYGWSRHSIPFSPPIFTGRLFFHAPQRGDIVVFKLPSSGHIDYIKRLIGLPGDRIQLRHGLLYINDKPVGIKPLGRGMGHLPGAREMQAVLTQQETNPEGRAYRTQLSPGPERAGDTSVYVVPPHCYFMMGDNRDDSADSRFDPGLSPGDPRLGGCAWDSSVDAAVGGDNGVGFVPEENLVGKAQIILLSWDTGSDEEDTSKASIFKPWTWFTDARPSRFFRVLH